MDDIKNYEDLVDLISDENIKVVNLRFTDLIGYWQHITIPVGNLTESFFKKKEDGLHFDVSQFKGWVGQESSTMHLKPVEKTAFIDPFSEIKTLILICNIFDPNETTFFNSDPRCVAIKAEEYLISLGLGDSAKFAPEASFFIFDDIKYSQSSYEGFYQVGTPNSFLTSKSNCLGSVIRLLCGRYVLKYLAYPFLTFSNGSR